MQYRVVIKRVYSKWVDAPGWLGRRPARASTRFEYTLIKQSGRWWIGWLLDLPGVNAQEKTRETVIESLRIGAEEILATEAPFEVGSTMILVNVPNPEWAAELA